MVSIWASYAISKKNRFHFYFVFSFEGFGWFTINLINTYFNGDDNDDFSSIHLQAGCKPFIKLYVNDKLAKESPTRKDKTLQDADLSFETAKISKTLPSNWKYGMLAHFGLEKNQSLVPVEILTRS